MKTTLLKILILLLLSTSNLICQTYWLTFHKGENDVLLSAPHGGILKPSFLKDRNCINCEYQQDGNTIEILKFINKRIEEKTKKSCWYVYSNIHRSKIDFNRDSIEAVDSVKSSIIIWKSYHDKIKLFSSDYTKIVIDIHGHTHKENYIELGGLEKKKLIEFGNLLNKRFINQVYPSSFTKKPKKYFNGGYITKTIYNKEKHLQIEIPQNLRNGDIKKTSEKIADSIIEFFQL